MQACGLLVVTDLAPTRWSMRGDAAKALVRWHRYSASTVPDCRCWNRQLCAKCGHVAMLRATEQSLKRYVAWLRDQFAELDWRPLRNLCTSAQNLVKADPKDLEPLPQDELILAHSVTYSILLPTLFLFLHLWLNIKTAICNVKCIQHISIIQSIQYVRSEKSYR